MFLLGNLLLGFFVPIIFISFYRTSVQASTRFSPFFLMYFREAKLPLHVQMEGSLDAAGAAPIEQFPTCREQYENIDVLVELQESYRTKAAKIISCAQARQKRQYQS